jgi:hypothetical protein
LIVYENLIDNLFPEVLMAFIEGEFFIDKIMKLKVYETFLGFKFVPSPDGIY